MRSQSSEASRAPTAVSLTLLSVLSMTLPAAAQGQTVTGEVVDGSTGAPLRGVLVRLLSQDSSPAVTVVSNAQGRFIARIDVPGVYVLRAEHLGYGAFEERDLDLTATAGTRRRIVLHPQALSLKAIEVETGRRCVVARDLALDTHIMWSGAQQAFHASSWDPAARARVFRSVIYERELEPRTRRVRWERGDSVTSRGAAFLGAPADLVHEHGYVRASGAGYEFYSPDPALLTSDMFADNYCLRMVDDAGSDGRVGLAFQPVSPRSGADIRGTVWFDAATLVLRSVEFTYTWMPWDVEPAGVGGRMEFAPLSDGGWIVQRWSIRTPRVESSPYGRGHRLVGLDESAGEVLRVLGPRNAVLASFAGARLEGTVYDSARGGYAAGVQVLLEGTGKVATTDRAGRFLMEDLPSGEYVVRVEDDTLPSAVSTSLSLSSGRTTRATLALPGQDTRLRSRCRRGIVGVVTDRSGTPVPGVPISGSGSGNAVGLTDASGGYALCDLPVGTTVSLRLGQPANPMMTVTVITSDSVQRRDIQVPRNQTGTGSIVGTVRDIDQDGGIAAAIVRIEGSDRSFLTDAAGRFAIAAIGAGTHVIHVEALGYGNISQTVAVGADEQIRLEVRLGQEAIALPELEVVARSSRPGPLAGFAERRELGTRLGIGVFLDRAALQRRGSHVIDVVRGMPRVRLEQAEEIGRYRIVFGSGITACEPNIYVDGILLTRPAFAEDNLEELIPPGPYEAVEIYRTPAELPAEFGGSDGRCGAIVIWMPRY